MKSPITFQTIIVCLLFTVLSSCNKPPETEGITFQHSIFSFGTIIDIQIHGVDETIAEEAFDLLEADFRFMHMNWQPQLKNALKRNNSLIATTEWFSDGPSVRPLLQQSMQLAKASEDLFNPAIGKLIQLWGFNSSEHATGFPPNEDAIKQLVTMQPSLSDLELADIRLRSKNPSVSLNFGGFAKGYGIRQEMKMLAELGIKNAIINAGGDLEVMGQHGNRPWRIGIIHPRKKDTVLAYLDVKGHESVFTSGDYERYFIFDNKRYHHILDPRTGYPAEGVQSVTVIHSDAAVADAAATALFVAGVKDWHRIARSMGISYVLLIDENGTAHMNPKMQARIKFQQQPDKIQISPPLP